jgi:uncharacterized membrane protein AbrB (regulator of aidB expression)
MASAMQVALAAAFGAPMAGVCVTGARDRRVPIAGVQAGRAGTRAVGIFSNSPSSQLVSSQLLSSQLLSSQLLSSQLLSSQLGRPQAVARSQNFCPNLRANT